MMYRIAVICLALPFFVLNHSQVSAQDGSFDFRQQFLNQFEYSSNKILALAEEMPEEKYTWSPGEGVMSVARVYMHIARYNYQLAEGSLDIPAPEGIDLDTMEEITGKAEVLEHLSRSIEHVKSITEEISDEKLEETTELYGRSVEGWAVLFQLITHMNEHVGQSIAYARMNGIVPPWSN